VPLGIAYAVTYAAGELSIMTAAPAATQSGHWSASYAIIDAGAKQPGSVGFGPHSGSQNRDVRQLRSRASHFARSSGISPKLIPRFANRARSRVPVFLPGAPRSFVP